MSDENEDLVKQTHPGFTITCDKCGSDQVEVENTMGYSAESGGWGSVDLHCLKCDARTEIVES